MSATVLALRAAAIEVMAPQVNDFRGLYFREAELAAAEIDLPKLSVREDANRNQPDSFSLFESNKLGRDDGGRTCVEGHLS